MGQKLGQHFLKNKKILSRIAEACFTIPTKNIIEIGPGHGELTENLKSQISNLKNCKLILIEKDKKLAEELKKKYEKEGNIEIICGDAISLLPKITKRSVGTCGIVGNIPYYITGYLLRVIQGLEKKPLFVVVTTQKEVAERIIQKPPQMNLLAASVQYWAKPKIIQKISKRDFTPQPKIDSATLFLEVIKQKNNREDKKYYETLKTIFKQPRKTIKNNITQSYRSTKECNGKKLGQVFSSLEQHGIRIDFRPQDMGVEHIKTISRII
jgi:16S rRNA (adenine1518-N6/adenine1519-N6)-dimethyltransferase